MALNAYVGAFNVDTSITAGNTQAITGVGFQPSVVIFFWGGRNTSEGVNGGDLQGGIGAMYGGGAGQRFSFMFAEDDGAATTVSRRKNDTASAVKYYDQAGTSSTGQLDFGSFDSDGFTVVYDEAFPAPIRVGFIALAGSDLLNWEIGNYLTPTVTGNYATTGVGFKPSLMLFACGGLTSNTSGIGDIDWALGMTDGTNQGVVFGFSNSGALTTDTAGYCHDGECILGRNSSGSFEMRESIVSFDSDGFTLNHLEGGTARNVFWLAIQVTGDYAHVGNFNTRTDNTGFDVTGLGFQPAVIMFASANRAKSTQDTVSANLNLSVGAASSPSNRACWGVWSENALADSECSVSHYDTAVYARTANDTTTALMDVTAIGTDGFSLVMDDTEDSAGAWVTYFALGTVPTTPIPVFDNHYKNQGMM